VRRPKRSTKLRHGGDGYILVWGGVTLWRSLMQLDLIDEWSPDGTMIVFELWSQGEEHIYTVRSDGSDLTAIVNTPGVDEKDPAWGAAV
jgi:hypothetical protein